MMRQATPGLVGLAVAVAFGIGFASMSEAQPPGPAAFCEAYPNAPACTAGEVSCATCHEAPPSFNVYGRDVADVLAPGEGRPLHADVFSSRLGEALAAVEGKDSDGDGFTNLEEIEGGSSPSDPSSTPEPVDCVDAHPNDGWNVCGYDHAYAFKRVMLDFCGHSPTLQQRRELDRAKDKATVIHETLDACLDSEHWRGIDGRVWNLANDKINPTQAVKSGVDAGPIPLADYDDDYAYWVWTQTDDRDAREALTGTYFVESFYEGGATVYKDWNRDPDRDYDKRGFDRYQAVDEDRRAGLLTHRWFLMSHTMFTGVPRTTAAQAYRAFLGYDIARLEGLHPVDGEPADYDSKGVAAEGCEACHSTLDPLTYPFSRYAFSRYEGIGGGNGRYESYAYNGTRLDNFTWVDGARVADTPESGILLGEPVADLVEWAEVAANSEAFRRALVRDYWRLLFHEDPRATDQADFGQLVADFGAVHDHRVERMLHALIDTVRRELLLAFDLVAACGTTGERDVSSKARVSPKGGAVWGNDLARGLGLQSWELCRELGSFDCIDDAHLVTLGGVEPERLGIDKPLANALVSAPIAIDRVAISACGERYTRDQEGPAVLFGAVLDKDSAASRKAVSTLLIQRLLSREPTAAELDSLETLHEDVSAVSSDPARDWAIGACVVVATSTEALFY
jgi:hypothetical protein